jgi:hypothetical protein
MVRWYPVILSYDLPCHIQNSTPIGLGQAGRNPDIVAGTLGRKAGGPRRDSKLIADGIQESGVVMRAVRYDQPGTSFEKYANFNFALRCE